jgi:sterol desaturase/sphingolipid hydroxylase (fatty acid hydroxylase superfamily)
MLPLHVLGVFGYSNVWFYVSHRLFHTKLFYKYHVLHHSVPNPPPLATFYCSLIEHILVNTGTFIIPLILIPLPYELNLLWTWIIVFKSTNAHMGTLNKNDHHYRHHKNPLYNFGAKPFVDVIFGTYK